MTNIRILYAIFAALLLSACAEGQEKQTVGTVIGAGVGAVLGAQVGEGKGRLAGVAIGTLAGAWLGSEAGKSLDRADQMYAQRTAQSALEYNKSGQASTWRNPDSGHSGSYMPTRSYRVNGKDCREFDATVTVDGTPEIVSGRACRDTDGKWRIVP